MFGCDMVLMTSCFHVRSLSCHHLLLTRIFWALGYQVQPRTLPWLPVPVQLRCCATRAKKTWATETETFTK
jgi:hypothetical protein